VKGDAKRWRLHCRDVTSAAMLVCAQGQPESTAVFLLIITCFRGRNVRASDFASWLQPAAAAKALEHLGTIGVISAFMAPEARP
jgi:hypothetical protein